MSDCIEESRARSDQVESGTRSRFFIWSHFLRQTASHFAGKCSSARNRNDGRGICRMRAPQGAEIAAGDVLLAVEDVSLDIRKGEIRAIIGPNGAGKTSMLNIINGFYHPQQGRITFKGKGRARMR